MIDDPHDDMIPHYRDRPPMEKFIHSATFGWIMVCLLVSAAILIGQYLIG